jgi:hypothetical protein
MPFLRSACLIALPFLWALPAQASTSYRQEPTWDAFRPFRVQPHQRAGKSHARVRRVRHSSRGSAHRGHSAHHHAGRHLEFRGKSSAVSGGTVTICAARGCARVAAWAADRFRGLIRDLEGMGYAVGHPSCLSSGHMRHSLHHTGRACDLFDQTARDRTRLRQPPPAVQIAVAEKHWLRSGCAWHDRDCGHFEVPTGHTRYASRRRSPHRYATAH